MADQKGRVVLPPQLTNGTRRGTQPKLSISNADLKEKFAPLLTIPKGKKAGPVFIARIGDKYTMKNGAEVVPVSMAQRRDDISTVSGGEAARIFLGWDGFETVLRHTQNVKTEIFEEMKLEEGMVVDGADLWVDYALTPFPRSNGQVDRPVISPNESDPDNPEQVLAYNGKPVYRQVRLQFEENNGHTGMDIKRVARLTPVEDVELSDGDLEKVSKISL